MPVPLMLSQTKDFQWALWANSNLYDLGEPTKPIVHGNQYDSNLFTSKPIRWKGKIFIKRRTVMN